MNAAADRFDAVRLAAVAPDPTPAGKAGWRALAEARGRARASQLRTRHAEVLARIGVELADAAGAGAVVALYAPIGTEVDTRPLANALLVAGHALAYPRLGNEPGAMEMAAADGPAALRARPRSRLLEPQGAVVPPEAIGVVFVPALAVDGSLRRLGRAGGYYDRWLARLPAQTRVVMVTPASCVLPWGPAEPHDQAGHCVVTEAGCFAPAEALR